MRPPVFGHVGRFGAVSAPVRDVRQGQDRIRPYPFFADELQIAVQQQGQRPADRQAEARASEAPGDRGIGLGKAGENMVHLVGRNARPGISDDNTKPPIRQPGIQPDMTGLSEFGRIADNVREYLSQPGFIPHDRRSDLGRDLAGNFDIRIRPRRRDQVHDILDHLANVERPPFDLQPSGIDLGKVENVVDDFEQCPAGRRNPLHISQLVIGQRRRLENIGEAHDSVQWCTGIPSGR